MVMLRGAEEKAMREEQDDVADDPEGEAYATPDPREHSAFHNAAARERRKRNWALIRGQG